MDTYLDIENQEVNERRFGRHHIDGYIKEEILGNPEMLNKISQGVELLEQYRSSTYSYESKNNRVAQLQDLDLEKLVLDLFIGVAYFQKDELFTSVTAQLAGRVGFDDKKEAIQTMAEILAYLCQTDAFDLNKPTKYASITLVSRIPLSQKLQEFIANSTFLPPMVCEPLELRNNRDTGYLTLKDSLILGGNINHHNGDICLDVLNKMNKVKLQLDVEFLSTLEEEPTFDIKTPEQQEQWDIFKKQSYQFYTLMVQQGNRFHLTHRVDKRGRIYSHGYHINTQGTPFKKACIELANEEVVGGEL